MNCQICGNPTESTGIQDQAQCECPNEKKKPGLWLLILIFATGLIALLAIWLPKPDNEARVDLLIARAKDLQTKESYAQAIETLQQAISISPNRADVHSLLAKTLFDNDQPNEALEQITQAAKLDPDSYEVQETYAEGLEDAGATDQALEQFNKVIAKFPQQSLPRQHAAELLEEKGKLDAALTQWQKASKIDAADEIPYLRIALLMRQKGDSAAALKSLEDGLKSSPESADLHFYKGAILADLNRHSEATAALNKASELDSEYASEVAPIVQRLHNAKQAEQFHIVPMKETTDGLIVQAEVEGRARANLILDSGSAMTIVSHRVAKALALDTTKLDTRAFGSATGVDHAPTTHLDVKLGSATAKKIRVSIYNIPGSSVDGLLGRTFLNNFTYTVDKKHSQLVLMPR